jgi:hypothetical protein
MSPVLGIIASSTQQGRAGGLVGCYDALASVTLTDTSASVIFAGVPQGYEDLEIIFTAYDTDTDGSGLGNIRVSGFFNSDTTATNYYNHFMLGEGNATASGSENSAKFFGNAVRTSQTSPGVNVISILDYASSTKNTVVRTLTGFNDNSTNVSHQGIRLISGLWNNTAPVTSITLVPELGSFKANSKFTLFGVK